MQAIPQPIPARRVLCRTAQSRRSQVKQLLGASAVMCDSDSQAEHTFAAQIADRIVWEVSLNLTRGETLPLWLLRAAFVTPVLLLVDSSGPAMRAVAVLARRASHLRVSLIGHDDLQCDLRALASDPPWHDAEQPLVARLAHQVPLLARNTIILAALTAKRRVTVEQLAEVSAVSFGTLRYRLREVGAPTVREVLGLFLCAHTVWRLDVLSWSVKQAAAAAGFGNTSALANYVRRHTGLAPCNLARSVGFNGFLESIVEVFFPEKQSRMTRAPDVWHTPIAHHESGWSSVKVI